MPPQIHMIWMQGVDKIPQRFKDNLALWRQYANVRIWDQEMIRQEVQNHFPSLIPIYDGYKLFIQRVDLGRLVILYVHGGLYLDIDTQPRGENIQTLWRRLDRVEDGYIVTPGPNVPYVGLPSMDAKLCNWLMYTPKPGQTFLKVCLDNIHRHTKRGLFQLRSYYVSSSTGAVFLTQYLDETCQVIKVNDAMINQYAGTWIKLDLQDIILFAIAIIIVIIIIVGLIYLKKYVRGCRR